MKTLQYETAMGVCVNSSLKKKIQDWRERIGYKDALETLIIVGVSESTAQKLLAGTYEPEPKRLLLQAIEMAMYE